MHIPGLVFSLEKEHVFTLLHFVKRKGRPVLTVGESRWTNCLLAITSETSAEMSGKIFYV
jgi:hypothetical protein